MGSKGILESLKQNSKELKNETSEIPKNEGIKEVKSKRSYALKESTIQKLQELKVFHYPVGTALEEIVDEAICELYKKKKGE